MTRTRSEYRLAPIGVGRCADPVGAIHPIDAQRDALATLMLAAYRNTIDDEGEDLDDAREAIDHYLATMLREHSFVVVGEQPIAFSFVVVVDGVHYIDPVVVAPDCTQRGLGSAVVRRSVRSLADAGIAEVGATITDGNVASERLFARLGFIRLGPWPP